MEILARGVGRRKEAVAQVQIVRGTGQFLINSIPAQQYLHNNICSILSVKAPLNVLNPLNMETSTNVAQSSGIEKTENLANVDSQTNNQSIVDSMLDKKNTNLETIDTIVKVKGGGLAGQAEAIKLGLARALCSLTTTETGTSQEEIRKNLKDKGFLTQDSRVKERRKYGLKKARKATQYNKR